MPAFFVPFLILFVCNQSPDVHMVKTGNSISERISTPEGYTRQNSLDDTWAYYLQHLELMPHGSKILDYEGSPILNQSNHVAIIKMDIGKKDLQQCADAIIRLRSEYLYSIRKYDDIGFKFTSGHYYSWKDYSNGIRPTVSGNKVTFSRKATSDDSYEAFRSYLDIIFMYAGTISLERDLTKVSGSSNLEIGDVIIKAGSPGHAILIVDKAKDENGNSIYLLAEGYTPAQSIHVLKGDRGISPWYKISESGSLTTSRYYFDEPRFRRFN